MIKIRVVPIIATLCFFAFIATFSAMSRPAYAQACDSVTDKQFVDSIYAKIRSDRGLAGQARHINVTAVFGAVKLLGWADSKKDHEKIVGFAMDTDCVKMVNANMFGDAPPPESSALRVLNGCAPGTKACGDICIPEGDACNISDEKQSARNTITIRP